MLLAVLELLGAALFAFETPLVAGFALLIGSFTVAGAVHLHHGETPWWLVAYSLVATLLWRFTVRVRCVGGRA